MSSPECRRIERKLNSIVRDLASRTNDGINTFSQPETYENDFPPINHTPHKYGRKSNTHPSLQASHHSINTGQEVPKGKTYKKLMKRNDAKFRCREESDFHEHNIRKRKDYAMKSKPDKLETNRNFVIMKQIPNDKYEFDGSNLHSKNALGNKLKDKEIHVLTVEDIEEEQSIPTDSYKKPKNFKHTHRERKKRTDHPKSMDDKKIQANIFLNALTEVSSIGEAVSKKDKVKKLVEDKMCCKTEGAVHSCEDDVFQCNTESHLNIDSECQNRIITSSDKKTVWNIHDNHDAMISLLPASVSGEQSSKAATDEVKNDDEFITRCNKESCSCSEDSLYCTLCDFHIDNRRELERHRKQMSHEVRKKDYFRIRGLEALNPPSQSNLIAIEELLQKVYITHTYGAEDNKQRKQIIEQLRDDLVFDIEKDCKFHLFGSSINGFGQKESNVNIDLEVPQGISPSKMLLKTFDALQERENKYGNIARDFSATFPSVSFMDRRTKLTCEITLNNDLSRKTSMLLKQYAQFDDRVRKLGTIFRIWAKISGIDQQEFCSLPPHCFPLMVIYFLQQTDPPVLPVLHEILGENFLICELGILWESKNKLSLAELWMNLLRFYSITFEYKTCVISVRQSLPLLCKDKKWTTRMMCIEDPYHTKRNLARTIANSQWFQYILECIRSTYEYFCTCRLSQAIDDVLAEVENCSYDDEEESSPSLDETSIDTFFEDQDTDLQINSVIASIKAMDLGSKTVDISHNVDSKRAPEYKNIEYVRTNVLSEKKHCLSEFMDKQSWENSTDSKEIVYKFEKSHMINVKPPLLFCRQCQKVNHVKKHCTIDENLPEMKKLPKMENDHKDMLTELCENVFSFCRPTLENIQQNKQLLCDLQRHIQGVFRDAQLELFGSSCNGFGFGDSDLDICLTFHNKSADEFDQKDIIEQLTKELNKYRKIRSIIPIPTAKVPIIKCSFFGRKEGDISLYNTLGQHNTRLLLTYCKIDQRVQLLGYALKFFAKKCDICDASRGSLSSYAYILMAIFYLQQLDVPVIPVLQELYDHNEKRPERYVDSWNTWFYEDINQLPSIWHDYRKNKQDLGELWIGLLVFYTEKFKMAEFVISIRQKAPMTRFEKLWNTRSIAIEDPFDHSHNLGAGVSSKMNTFIIAAFRRGRDMFGRTPPARRDIENLLEFFFNTKILTGGEKPPNERGCRICSKIGHKMKECPLRRENFKKRHNFDRKNNPNVEQQQGKFQKGNRFIERNRVDRHGMCNVRGIYRARRNFHEQHETRETVINYNPNRQSC